jgi:hypothetical protein
VPLTWGCVNLLPPLDAVDAALRQHFGQQPGRASVSFVGVEPIAVLRFEPIPDERAYVSLGMARHPMTAASATSQSTGGPRAELMLRLRDGGDLHASVWRHLAVLAAAPAVEGVVYSAGMTVDLGQPLTVNSRCTGGLVIDAPIGPIEATPGPVSVLEILPATSTELAWCRVHGSAALQARWAEFETDLLDLGRVGVVLA